MVKINRVAILGASRLGVEIAVHLANCGLQSLLLDWTDPSQVIEEMETGNVHWPVFFLPELKSQITTGTFRNALNGISEYDWIIDAISDSDLEKDILRQIDTLRSASAIVSTTNSVSPICSIVDGLSEDFRRRWLGTHFLRPVQHRNLVELIPCPFTDQNVIEQITEFCEDVLGKGVVIAKDTYGFIADRVSDFSEPHSWRGLEAIDIRDVVYRGNEESESLWKILSEMLVKTADNVAEMANDIVSIDNALRWGKDWTIGPFQIWDAMGIERTVNRLRDEGREIPKIVENLLASGNKTFYRRIVGQESYFDFKSNEYKPIKPRPGVTSLRVVQAVNGVISKNPHATILDLGDGVICLEVHSQKNAISTDATLMLNYAIDLLENDEFEGLVIGNQGRVFCAGIHYGELLKDIENGWWPEVQKRFENLQKLSLRIKYASKPITVAAFGETLGYGHSIVLHSASACLAAETRIGLDELANGLVPIGGGAKELYLRATVGVDDDAEVFKRLRTVFENIERRKTSNNALLAKRLGYVPDESFVVLDRDRLIETAKQITLKNISDRSAHSSRKDQEIRVLGESAYNALLEDLNVKNDARKSAMLKLARVLTGGDLNHPDNVSEQYVLELELDALMTLCSDDETVRQLKLVWTG